MHFVNPMSFSQLVEFAKKLREQLNHLNWVFNIVAELREAHHVGVQQSDIFEHVDYSLVVFNSS